MRRCAKRIESWLMNTTYLFVNDLPASLQHYHQNQFNNSEMHSCKVGEKLVVDRIMKKSPGETE